MWNSAFRQEMRVAMNVLIVDDHEIVRSGVMKILERNEKTMMFGEAASYKEALKKLREKPWDAALVDISLPDKSGLELVKRIKRDWNGLPVLVMSIYPEEQYAVRTIRAGAAGYITKESGADEFCKAVKKAAQGGRYITDSVANQLAEEFDNSTEATPHEALSDREYQFLCLIGTGKSVTDIAEELSVSVKTVSTYRRRVLKKMGMRHNVELMHYVVKSGLVSDYSGAS